MGYSTISEIGKERIRRAGDKIKSESPMTTQDLDIGFRVLKLDDTNMKDVYYAPDDYDQGMLAGLESNIKEDRTDLDLLFGCLIDWGLPLSLPYKSEQIDGCTVHTYNDGDLIACFDAVKTAFSEELTPCGDIAHWTNPKGGYFISLYVMPGCAKRVAQLCKECGLTLTGAGSAYPYHKDPQDSHLRIAPTYPSLDEVETASDLLCVCVKLAVIEKLLAEKAE